MTNEFLLGTLLSIPIGIGTGLAVTPIQRWLEHRGKTKSAARTERLKDEYQATLLYHENPQMFTQYLIQVAIKTTFIGSAVGILVGIIYGATNLVDLGAFSVGHHAISLMYFVAQMVVTMSSILIVRICSPALAFWYRVRDFDAYTKQLPPEIAQPQAMATPA